MLLFNIKYIIGNDQNQWNVNIVETSKEKAVAFLKQKVPKLSRIESISKIYDVHAISDDIMENEVNKSPKIKKYRDKIAAQNRLIEEIVKENDEFKLEIEQLYKDKDKITSGVKENEKVINKPIPVLCTYCDKTFTSERGLKIHMTKAHADIINK